MDAKAREALHTIRDCCAQDRFRLLPHFRKRMAQRGLLWPDILAVLDEPEDVRGGKHDRHRRPKWIIRGTAIDGLAIEFVCVLDDGELAVFITIYGKGAR